MRAMDCDAIAKELALSPHPEGGFYRETWRSPRTVEGPGGAPRAASTSILFLLPPGHRSDWHLVTSDEIWLHQQGGPLELHLLDDEGHRVVRLGPGGVPQAVVPAGVWQAARPAADEGVLCGCVVAPGFDFADFTLGRRDALRTRFPEHLDVVDAFTSP